jgi:hypothetical protein
MSLFLNRSKLKIIFSLLIVVMLGILAFTLPIGASPTADCEQFGTGYISPLSSLSISFTCTQDSTVYFGACDSGNVPDDDLFNITFNGAVVSTNSFGGGREYVSIGTASAAAGSNTATLNSLNTTPFPPATYSFAISSDQGAVSNYLVSWCGVDYSSSSACSVAVPVFTQDKAPSAGTLELRVQFGNMNRPEGYTIQTWDVYEGQQINNDTAVVPAPQYVRVWWQPDGSTEWYLLTSQYWTGDGTTKSEFGVSCGVSSPSYHTSFASAIEASKVPTLNQ